MADRLRYFLACLSFFGWISAYAQADNDNFRNAFELPANEGTFFPRNFDSTFEEGEPITVSGSVWYKWQAPANGVFQLGGGLAATLYVGNEVGNLQKVEGVYLAQTGMMTWPVRGGELYHLAVNQSPYYVVTPSYRFLSSTSGDSFALRSQVGTNLLTSGVFSATRESGEPAHNSGATGGSIWWAVPPVETGCVALQFRNEPLGTFFVYEGEELSQLKEVIKTSGSLTNDVLGFNVEAGKQYSIAFVCQDDHQAGAVSVATTTSPMQLRLVDPTRRIVAGQPVEFEVANIQPADGEMSLRLYIKGGPKIGSWSRPFPEQIQITNLPAGASLLQLALQDSNQVVAVTGTTITALVANDAFQDRILLQGTNGGFDVPLGGTAEPREPLGWAQLFGSVWYEWAPPEDGVLIVNFPYPELYVNLANQLSLLRPVPGIFATNSYWPSYWRPTGFIVSKGFTYDLRLWRNPGTLSWCSFQFYPRAQQNNDRIANAFELSGTELSFVSSALGGNLEPREPSSWGLSASVWYKWVAPGRGVVQVSIRPRELLPPTDIALFRKTDLLIPVPRTYPVRAQVQQGERIYIQHLADPLDYWGSLISLNFFPTPKNDDFQNAELLEGEKGEFNVDTSGATNEPEELEKGLAPGLWHKWVAPTNGLFHISPVSSSMAFMSGPTLPGLTNVPSSSSFTRLFPVEAGITYYIRAGYESPPTAKYQFEFFPGLARENDTFENASLLSGTSIRAPILTVYATPSDTDPMEIERDGSKHRLENTVWFDWIAPISGWTTVSTRKVLEYYVADDSRTMVFSGRTASNPTEVATSDGTTRKLEFRADKGERYHFMIGELGSTGTPQTTSGALLSMELSLAATRVSAPTNGTIVYDDQLLSCDVSAADGALAADLNSVKYSITDTSLGWIIAQLSTQQAPFGVAFSNLYAGNFELRAEVSAGDPAWVFPLEPVVFSVRSHLVSFDFFDARELLTGSSIKRDFSVAEIAAATREQGEPPLPGNLPTFWFRWVAPFDGRLVIGSGWLSTNVLVFEGDALSNLVRVRTAIVSKGHEYALQVPAYAADVPLTLRLDTLLENPPDGLIYSESDFIPINARTTDDANVTEVILFGNGQVLSVMTAPTFTTSVKLTPGTYIFQSVHRLQNGVLFTNEISSSFPVYAANITPDASLFITNSQVTIDARGFTADAPTAGAFLNGPPLYYRIRPEKTLLVVAQASLEVRAFTNRSTTLNPIPPADIRFSQEPFGSPVFRLEAGGDYLLTVRSPQNLNAAITFRSPVPNDNFEDAFVIPAGVSEVQAELYFSTVQPWEKTNLPPEFSGIYGSVWYRWTAPSSGTLGIDSRAHLFSGDGPETLREMPRRGDEVYFKNVYPVVNGTSYYIGVFADSFSSVHMIRLSIQTNEFLSNDNVAHAEPLSGTNVFQFYLFPRDATYEPGEDHRIPNGYDKLPGIGSLWWRWTAPANGVVHFPGPLGPSTRYTLYQKTDTGRILVPAESPGDLLESRWKVEASKEYLLAVEVYPPSAQAENKYFDSSISFYFAAYSANDAFAQRKPLTGESVQLDIPPYRGSREFGEPLHAGEYGGQSLWYSWRAPFSGPVRVNARWELEYWEQTGGLVGIYQGNNVRNLTVLSSIGSRYPTNFTTFQAIEGTEYQIAADSGGLNAPLTLLIERDIPVAVPPVLNLLISPSLDLLIEISPRVSTPFTVESSSDLIIWRHFSTTNLNDRGEFSLPIGTNQFEFYRVLQNN